MFRSSEEPVLPANEIKAGDIIGFSGDSWISAGSTSPPTGFRFGD